MKKRIFVIDDDHNIRQIITRFLEREGFTVVTFSDGSLVLAEMRRLPADCIVLDIMMPGIDGLNLCREIRKTYQTPIIFVSAKGEEIDRILGLELGADDYLVKPFSPRELVVRVKAVLRRVSQNAIPEQKERLSLGNVTIDFDARVLRVGQQTINVTNKEFDLFAYLMENAHKALSRDQIIEAIWGYDYVGDMRSVDDLVRRLRRKIRAESANLQIETVWGYGYKLEEK